MLKPAPDWLHEEAHGPWFFRARKIRNGHWYAEARQGGFEASHALHEPMDVDVYFDFAETREQVLAKLKAEVWN